MHTTRGAPRCSALERFQCCSRVHCSYTKLRSRTGGLRSNPHLPPRSWRRAAVTRDSQLVNSLESLHDLIVGASAPYAIDAQVAVVAELALELGKNKVDPKLIVGSFDTVTSGARTDTGPSSNSTLDFSTLHFNAVQPPNLTVDPRPQSPGYYRGPEGDLPMAMVVRFGFHIPKCDVLGISKKVAVVRLDDSMPQRLSFAFQEVQVYPDLARGQEEAQLQRWLDLLSEPNGDNMDTSTGCIRAVLAEPLPGWLDVIAMVPGWELFRSHRGPIALQRRVG